MRSSRALVRVGGTAARAIAGAGNSRPGILAAGSALAAQWLLRKAVPDAPFAPYSLANRAVRMVPGEVATWTIDRFEHHALDLSAAASITFALGLGAALGRKPPALFASLALGLAVVAAFMDPVHPATLPSFASATVAALAAFASVAALPQQTDAATAHTVSTSRRQFTSVALLGAGFVGLGGIAAWRALVGAAPRALVRADRTIFVPGSPEFEAIAGLSPGVTSTAAHYVVDINLSDPVLRASSWRLCVSGRVRSPLELSLADLRGMRVVAQPVLMQCISNQVGGGLIGNARWAGVVLGDLLLAAGADEEATGVLLRAADGYSETVPMDVVRDGEVLVVFGINGRLLPTEHGYPARLIFPGHYGMRSVKWLTSIEVRDDLGEGYWEKRGWDRDAIMRTGSRFDVPRHGDTVTSPLVAAGVAYAGDRGVSEVEISTDDGASWIAARLEASPGPLAWTRWATALHLSPGEHALLVRAVDATGATQPEERLPPHPSGASGYHRVVVAVE